MLGPLTNSLKHAAACRSMPQHAAASQNFLGDRWCLVPSHVDILGNNEADRLADQGRLSHPRCPVLRTPSRDFTATIHTPPIKRQRRNTGAELDSVVQVLNFSPHKIPRDSQAMDAFMDLSLRIDPELLQGDWSPPMSDYSSDEI